VFSRTDWLSYLRIAKVVSLRDPDIKMRLLSRAAINYAGDLLRKLKGRIDLVKVWPCRLKRCKLNDFLVFEILS
jgi:hypothetical protein